MAGFRFVDWGIIPYKEAWERQKQLFESALRAKSGKKKATNTLVFCEHPPVFTLGKNGKISNLLYPEEEIRKKGIDFFHTERGGDITFHGTGQLVVYPVFDLESFGMGLKSYIFNLEECIVKLLELYGIQSERLPGAAGVWLDTDKPGKARKICAVGVRVSKFVTMHGLALNINTDLSYFGWINPCGLTGKGVTSIKKELGKEIETEQVKKQLAGICMHIFNS